MGMQNLWHDIGVVEELNETWLNNPALFPPGQAERVTSRSAYLREVLGKARAAFADERTERKDCEKVVTELLQVRRALEVITAENDGLCASDAYMRDYNQSRAALQHIASTVRLHFLLQDVEVLVADA